MGMEKIYEISAAVQESVDVDNALIAAAVALAAGIIIFIKRHTGAAK